MAKGRSGFASGMEALSMHYYGELRHFLSFNFLVSLSISEREKESLLLYLRFVFSLVNTT